MIEKWADVAWHFCGIVLATSLAVVIAGTGVTLVAFMGKMLIHTLLGPQ